MAAFLTLHLSAALPVGAMCGAFAATLGGGGVPWIPFRGGQTIVGRMAANGSGGDKDPAERSAGS